MKLRKLISRYSYVLPHFVGPFVIIYSIKDWSIYWQLACLSLSGIFYALLYRSFLKYEILDRRRKLRLCTHCGFDLQNATGAECPECGKSEYELDDSLLGLASTQSFEQFNAVLQTRIKAKVPESDLRYWLIDELFVHRYDQDLLDYFNQIPTEHAKWIEEFLNVFSVRKNGRTYSVPEDLKKKVDIRYLASSMRDLHTNLQKAKAQHAL